MGSSRRYITIGLFSLAMVFIGLTAYLITIINTDSRTSALGGIITNPTATPTNSSVTLFPVVTATTTSVVTSTPIQTTSPVATLTASPTTVATLPGFAASSTATVTVTTTSSGVGSVITATSTSSNAATATPTATLPNTGIVEDSIVVFSGFGLLIIGGVLYHRFKKRWYF